MARGGTNAVRNLQILCLPCHDGKTNEDGSSGPIRNMTDEEWRRIGCPQDWARKRRLLDERKGRGRAARNNRMRNAD